MVGVGRGVSVPLRKSTSDKAVGQNISQEMKAGRPRDQAIAIAKQIQRDAKKKKKKH